jgi:SAM-dependent methyltransferase
MRRVISNLLHCPRCRRGPLLPETDTQELIFGPIRCPQCQSSFPVAEGVADLVEEAREAQGLQRGFHQAWVARGYERYLRPAVTLAVARRRLDRDSEYLLYRSLLGPLEGPVLDLCAGTALFGRRLAREPGGPPVVALDVSRAMIEEGVAQTREAGVMVDFVRAEAPWLPFADHSLSAVLQAASLHLIADGSRMLMEVGRVLRPGGRYVASTYLAPGKLGRAVHRRAGLHPRTEAELRSLIAASGLVNFERMVLPPYIVVKAERPRLGVAR